LYKVWEDRFPLFISLAFFNCLARGKIFSRSGVLWDRTDSRVSVISEIKTEATGRGVIAITEIESPDEMSPKFIAVLVHPSYQKTRIIGRQISKVFSRDFSQCNPKTESPAIVEVPPSPPILPFSLFLVLGVIL